MAKELTRQEARKFMNGFKRKMDEIEHTDLNIVPMMDMMTILLVFLIKSMTASAENIALDQDLQMPKALTSTEARGALNVQVTANWILVEGQKVVPIKRGKVDPADKRDGETGFSITKLYDEMKKQSERDKRRAAITGDKASGELTLMAHYNTPYRLILEVLYTAGEAEYGKYRLLVMSPNKEQ
ncbi:MAG: biopolymer transporter ExbD [Deltaproteobacteria bacterium]|nr:biopolymer transporter ExbD [Deltaproteobacteria bacterium]